MHSAHFSPPRTLSVGVLATIFGIGCAAATSPSVPPPTTAEPRVVQAAATAPSSSAAPTTVPPMTDTPPAGGATANSASFTWSAYSALRGNATNYVFSGYSLRQALAMTALGARGQTKSEMDAVLGTQADPPEAAGPLHVANRIWADSRAKVRADYANLLQARFGGGIETLPLSSQSELSRGKINGWVKDATSGKVVDLLPQNSINADTRLVLTNAVHFKANWAAEFSVSATKNEPFTDESGKQAPVAMMHKETVYRAAVLPDAKMVELAYQGSDLVMTILVPNDAAGLAKIESSLTTTEFAKSVASMKPQRVALALPKFTFRAGGTVNAGLQKLGIRTAFTSDRADFGGMLEEGSPPLKIDSVFHDAFIAVDEAGTEAAAATAVVMGVRGMVIGKPLEIRADRAFLFAIRNAKTDAIYFLGRVGKPTSSAQ